MDNSFPIQKSTLSTNAIKSYVAHRYNFAEPITCRFFQQTLNDLYLIQHIDTLYIFRVWSAFYTDDVVLEEILRIQALLSKQNLQVANPVLLPEGNYLEKINAPEGKRFAALFTFSSGKAVGRAMTLKQSFAIGQLTAELHLVSKSIKQSSVLTNYNIDFMVLEPIQVIKQCIALTSEQTKLLDSLAKNLINQVGKLKKTETNFGMCHGDIHGMNVISNSEVLSLIDFECLGYNWYAWDLAVFIWWIRGTDKEIELKNKFLTGYRSSYSQAEDVIKHFPIFVPIRHLLLTSQIIMHSEQGFNVGRWIDSTFLDERLAFIERWMEDYQLITQI